MISEIGYLLLPSYNTYEMKGGGGNFREKGIFVKKLPPGKHFHVYIIHVALSNLITASRLMSTSLYYRIPWPTSGHTVVLGSNRKIWQREATQALTSKLLSEMQEEEIHILCANLKRNKILLQIDIFNNTVPQLNAYCRLNLT